MNNSGDANLTQNVTSAFRKKRHKPQGSQTRFDSVDAGCPETDMFHQSIMSTCFRFFKEWQVESFRLQPQIS